MKALWITAGVTLAADQISKAIVVQGLDLATLGRLEVLPGFVYDLDYERLIADQEGETRRLIAHCGLEWNDACLDFHRAGNVVMTISTTQVRQPIYRDSVAQWRRYEAHLGPLKAALGIG